MIMSDDSYHEFIDFKQIEQRAINEHRSWIGKVLETDVLICLDSFNKDINVYCDPPAIVTILPTPDAILLNWSMDEEGGDGHWIVTEQDVALLVPYPGMQELRPYRLAGRRQGITGAFKNDLYYRLASPDVQAQFASAVSKLLLAHDKTEEVPLPDQDGVAAVLGLSLEQLRALPENGNLDVDAVIEFFQVDTLGEITQAMLDEARLTHGVAAIAEPAATVRKAASPAP